MKHIVSVSLGSSARDKAAEIDILGERVRIERRGTDGDKQRFQATLGELDGQVDAIGLGGCDRYLWIHGKRYTFRDINRLVSHVRVTPVLDGSGMKDTLERLAVERLDGPDGIDWPNRRVLLVSGLDRFGMAEAVASRCPSVVFGDAIFALGWPMPLRSLSALNTAATLLLPIVTRLPFDWLYPVGDKQESNKPMYARFFREADVIAGDWHFIRRYAPPSLLGKTILTNTIRSADVAFLRERQAARLYTTTPEFQGETFATNVLEALVVAMSGSSQLTQAEYTEWLMRLGWQVGSIDLTRA